MHAFWLVLTYDLLEDKRIDDVIKTFFFFHSSVSGHLSGWRPGSFFIWKREVES